MRCILQHTTRIRRPRTQRTPTVISKVTSFTSIFFYYTSQKHMTVHRQNLLVIAIVLIVIGAIIWLVAWPASAQPATDVIGQVVFWPGIALLIIWIIIFAYLEIKGSTGKP